MSIDYRGGLHGKDVEIAFALHSKVFETYTTQLKTDRSGFA